MDEIVELISPEGMNRREILSKRLKRKKRKRIALKIIVMVIILGILSFSVYLFVKKTRENAFSVKHIMVVGNETVNSKTVIEAARIPVNTSIFLIDMNQIYKNIDEKIDCSHLLITKKYPDTILVNIEEYPVFFAVIEKHKVYYLDEKYRIVEKSDYLLRNDISLVSGISGLSELEVGMTANLKPLSSAEEVKKILTILKNSGYDDRLSEIVVNSDRTISIITKNNLVVHVENLEQFKKQYDYIGSIVEKNKSNMTADLTLGEAPVIKNR